MSPTFEGETRQDRRRQWYVGVGAVIALFALVGCVVLTFKVVQLTNSNAQATASRDATIAHQNQRIIQLERQHGADLANEAVLLGNTAVIDGIIKQYVQNLDAAVNAICAKAGAGCSITFTPAPPPPKAPAAVTHAPPPVPHASPPAPAPPVPPTTTLPTTHPVPPPTTTTTKPPKHPVPPSPTTTTTRPHTTTTTSAPHHGDGYNGNGSGGDNHG